MLDDSDGELGLGVSEISIVRRLDRTGEGEYRLAGARCRLVDVIELLSDTGLGKEMHSVISQGRVESIVTSKPRERRLLIEEAAGLGKHRKRRRRAQLKLGRTPRTTSIARSTSSARRAHGCGRSSVRRRRPSSMPGSSARCSRPARNWCGTRSVLGARSYGPLRSRRRLHARSRAEIERALEAVGGRRKAAEETLAARSAQREELSRRCYQAQSAAERLTFRAESVSRARAAIATRIARGQEQLEVLRAHAAADTPDPGVERRIAELEAELAALARDREAELARQLARARGRAEKRTWRARPVSSSRSSSRVSGASRRMRRSRRPGSRSVKPSARSRPRGARRRGSAASWRQ